VELRRNVSCHQVEDKRHVAGVYGRLSQIYSKSNARVPVGYLSSCGLQRILENIDWAAKSVSVPGIHVLLRISKLAYSSGTVARDVVEGTVYGVPTLVGFPSSAMGLAHNVTEAFG
jgi:hypothetical protein